MCFTLKALLFGGKLGPSSGGISGNSPQYVPFGLDVPSELLSRYAESSMAGPTPGERRTGCPLGADLGRSKVGGKRTFHRKTAGHSRITKLCRWMSNGFRVVIRRDG